MENKSEKAREELDIYTDWFAMWTLLKMYEREFFSDRDSATNEGLAEMRERLEEIRGLIEHSKTTGAWKLERAGEKKPGGYGVIMKGLEEIKQNISQEAAGMSEKEWGETHYLLLKIIIEAWAQRMKAKAHLITGA